MTTRWGADPFAYGSYSSMVVGTHGGPDYDRLAESVGGRVRVGGGGGGWAEAWGGLVDGPGCWVLEVCAFATLHGLLALWAFRASLPQVAPARPNPHSITLAPSQVFFAGEATTKKYPATMHGAFHSGLEVVSGHPGWGLAGG